MRVAETPRGTASIMTEQELWPLERPDEIDLTGWRPQLNRGTVSLRSLLGEEVETAPPAPGWSTNVLESPLFSARFLAAPERPSLWEKLAQLRSMIPEEEREKYPKDGSTNLDKYLYEIG